MKLKKLLPLASVAGVTAIVAPLATSCTAQGAASMDFKMKQITSYEYTIGEYDPMFKQMAAPTKKVTYDAAKNMYYDEIAKNPSIIADDIMYSWVEYTNQYVSGLVTGYNPYEALEGSMSFKVDNWDADKMLLSMTIENHYNFQGLYISSLVTMDRGKVDSTIKIKNMPFRIALADPWSTSATEEAWPYFCPTHWGWDDLETLAYLTQDKDSGWSIEWDESWTINDDKIGSYHHVYWDRTNPTDEIYTVAGEYVNAAEALSAWAYMGAKPHHWMPVYGMIDWAL